MLINGRKYNYGDCITISQVLSNLKVDENKVVVEVNLSIVPKEEFNTFIVKENDSLEVLSFVGGG